MARETVGCVPSVEYYPFEFEGLVIKQELAIITVPEESLE